MTDIIFSAPEYQQDARFVTTEYRFHGSDESGWQIYRQGQLWLEPGSGYVPVKTRFCGICATDLARHHLPFPLPQIIGHEVVGCYQDQNVALEINASHLATGHDVAACPWCRAGLDIHCPDRLTLGIDRLPGGFAPWTLVPVNSIHPLPADMHPQAGVFIEPFAAALKAVETSPPIAGDEVAVLGPRRLGMLLLAALAGFRATQHIDFAITAVVRHRHLVSLCREAGADRVQVIHEGESTPGQQFDIVYDTTGSQSGFELALAMSRREVHLKSTHGKSVQGLRYLTDMVINEQSLHPYVPDEFYRHAQSTTGNIFLSPSIPASVVKEMTERFPDMTLYQGAPLAMLEKLHASLRDKGDSHIPQFDAALAGSLAEIDLVARPVANQVKSLLKPCGTVYLPADHGREARSALYGAVSRRRIRVHTSRCGHFGRAIAMLEQHPALPALMQNRFISHVFPLSDMAQAFACAADSGQSVKVLVDTTM